MLSYCYDIETGFYYLQTRYYDPTIACFINADCYLSTGATGLLSYNMFAYCENNPVMYTDPTGTISSLSDSINSYITKMLPALIDAADRLETAALYAVISALGLSEEHLAVAQTILGENASATLRDDWKTGANGIAWTIINRVNDPDPGFPDTAYEVVTAPLQYQGYTEGKKMAPNGILRPEYANRQEAWDYTKKIAAYLVLKMYDKIPRPEGFTDKTRFFAGGYIFEYGPMIYGGNKFRDQY